MKVFDAIRVLPRSGLAILRAQRRVAHSNGWKTRHGKSQESRPGGIAWMAGGRGNASF